MSFRVLVASAVGLLVALTAGPVLAATCSLGPHDGIEEADAKTAADVLCHAVVGRAPSASFEVRLGKLGTRTLVRVIPNGDEAHEARAFVNGLDEIDVAAPRLATSLAEARPLAETRTVDNVLADEGRMPKKVASVVGATMGMYVLSSPGSLNAPSAGVDVGLAFRTGHIGLTGDGRLGGIGSGEDKINNSSLDVGARLYLTDGEHAPFVGGGLAISYFHANAKDPSADRSGSGAGAFTTLGIEALRSSHVGIVAAARIDLPFYQLSSGKDDELPPSEAALLGLPSSGPKTTAYLAPFSVMLALSFH